MLGRIVIACALLLLPAGASAAPGTDEVARHVTAGQDLARTGDYPGAIREFEAADQLTPTASHACLIGLAELRRGQPGQAEVWFGQCRARATPDDGLPPWLGTSERELAPQLAKLTPVVLRIAPTTADAVVAIAGWDAPFVPRAVHLAPGHYQLTARAPGQVAATAEVDVTAVPQTVTLTLGGATAPAPVDHPPSPPPVVPEPRAARARYVLGAGAFVLVVGGVLDATWVRSTRNTLAAQPGTTYDDKLGAYHAARDTTVGVLAAGVITLGVGLVLHHREAESTVQIGASRDHGASLVTLAWTR